MAKRKPSFDSDLHPARKRPGTGVRPSRGRPEPTGVQWDRERDQCMDIRDRAARLTRDAAFASSDAPSACLRGSVAKALLPAAMIVGGRTRVETLRLLHLCPPIRQPGPDAERRLIMLLDVADLLAMDGRDGETPAATICSWAETFARAQGKDRHKNAEPPAPKFNPGGRRLRKGEQYNPWEHD